MKKTVHIENIGIIEESTVFLDGLTVITGHNNSGKTTVGKALYSVLSSVENLQSDVFNDKLSYVKRETRKLQDKLEMRNRYLVNYYFYGKEHIVDSDHNILKQFLQTGVVESFENISQLTVYLQRVYEETQRVTDDYLKEIIYGKNEKGINKIQIDDARRILETTLLLLIDNLGKDKDLVRYTNRKISKKLNLEFYDQILPVRHPERVGVISMKDETKKYFSISIHHNNIQSEKPVYFNNSYSNVIFIDDVYVMDRIAKKEDAVWKYMMEEVSGGDWSEGGKVADHNKILEEKLAKEPDNIFQEVLNRNTAEMLFEKIESILPGQIKFSKDRYICGNNKLDVRNLATGSKMFAIIKKLIENEQISNGTLLILDEPESHLHPAWQNRFAEIVVLMIKYLKIQVLLTTHSPNFLMAMEVYAKKYKIWDCTNMYCTEMNHENEMIHYVDVKDNMKVTYKKLADPLFELRALEIQNNAEGEG